MNWIGLIFLISLWVGGPPYGLNEEHFFTELDCWNYFDRHPSFKLLEKYSHNFYNKEYVIRLYNIDRVGVAWVTCKQKNEPRTMPNWGPR